MGDAHAGRYGQATAVCRLSRKAHSEGEVERQRRMLASAYKELPSSQPWPALEVTNGWKSFGHVTALRDVKLTAYPGEILAILGDNGAGKSTLVKVLAGVYNLDAGEFRINGQSVDRTSPR